MSIVQYIDSCESNLKSLVKRRYLVGSDNETALVYYDIKRKTDWKHNFTFLLSTNHKVKKKYITN